MTAIRKVYPTIDDPKQKFKDRKSVSKEDRAAAAFALLHQQVQQDRNETRESDGDTPT